MRRIWKSLCASRESNHLSKEVKKRLHWQTQQVQATRTCLLRPRCLLLRPSQPEQETSLRKNRKSRPSKRSPRPRKTPISHNLHLSSANSWSRSYSQRLPPGSQRKNQSRNLSLPPSRSSHRRLQAGQQRRLRAGRKSHPLARTKNPVKNPPGDHQPQLLRSQPQESLCKRRPSLPPTLNQGLRCVRTPPAQLDRIARAQHSSARMRLRTALGRTQQPGANTQVNKASSPLL